jgi:hypothetical protein
MAVRTSHAGLSVPRSSIASTASCAVAAVREVSPAERRRNANLDDLAQRYAGAQAAIEATSNYYHIYDTLSEHSDVTQKGTKSTNHRPITIGVVDLL